jgi:prepilin-type N-terminal cleavage/methylation domain-containing protein
MQAPLKQPLTAGHGALNDHERSKMINNMPGTKEKKSKMASNNKGFTLVEVMIGMAIFVIGYLAVASMQMVAIKGDSNARKTTEAATLAADRLETLMILPYDNIPVEAPDREGTVIQGAYTVKWEFDPGPLDNTKLITITVTWQHGGERSFEASYIKSANI